MSEKFMELLIYSLPALIAGLTCILTMFKILNGINEWKGSINDTNLKQLSKDMKNVIKKNQQLIQQNEEYKEKIQEVQEDLKKATVKINALSEQLVTEVKEEPKEEVGE